MIIDDKVVNLSIIDTPGQDEFREMTSRYIVMSDVSIVVFSLINLESFENVKNNWIPYIRSCAPDIRIVLCGTSKGCLSLIANNPSITVENQWDPVPESKINELVKNMHLDGYYAVSVKEGTNVNELFEFAARLGLSKKEQKNLKKSNNSQSDIIEIKDILYKLIR